MCAGLGRYSRARALIEQVEAASVDVVICDPPYPREYLDCWSELGEFAAHALKPGGLLVALSGQSFLPEVMQRLGQHLRWWWLVHYATPGELGDNRARRVSVTGKPLLVDEHRQAAARLRERQLQRPRLRRHRPLREERVAAPARVGPKRVAHDDAIQRFANPGDLVADPFLGSGTTAVAALRKGRRFVGGDLQPDCVQTTRTGWASERDLDFLLPLEQTRAAGRSGARSGVCPGARKPAPAAALLAVGQRGGGEPPSRKREPGRNRSGTGGGRAVAILGIPPLEARRSPT